MFTKFTAAFRFALTLIPIGMVSLLYASNILVATASDSMLRTGGLEVANVLYGVPFQIIQLANRASSIEDCARSIKTVQRASRSSMCSGHFLLARSLPFRQQPPMTIMSPSCPLLNQTSPKDYRRLDHAVEDQRQ